MTACVHDHQLLVEDAAVAEPADARETDTTDASDGTAPTWQACLPAVAAGQEGDSCSLPFHCSAKEDLLHAHRGLRRGRQAAPHDRLRLRLHGRQRLSRGALVHVRHLQAVPGADALPHGLVASDAQRMRLVRAPQRLHPVR